MKYNLLLIFVFLFTLFISNSCNANGNKMIVVEYTSKPQPFSWLVNGSLVEQNEIKLISAIKATQATRVIFKSHYKLTENEIDKIRDLLRRSKVIIQEFWVPISEPPGIINLEDKPS